MSRAITLCLPTRCGENLTFKFIGAQLWWQADKSNVQEQYMKIPDKSSSKRRWPTIKKNRWCRKYGSNMTIWGATWHEERQHIFLGLKIYILTTTIISLTSRVAQSVLRMAKGWTVRGWNPGGARFSAPVQIGPGTHPAFCTLVTAFCPGVKRPGRDFDYLPPSSAWVKERVEICL